MAAPRRRAGRQGGEQAVHFLMTGERPGKPTVTPPMPEYRFDKADAEAITACLKSIAK